jgi:hypothetical protein
MLSGNYQAVAKGNGMLVCDGKRDVVFCQDGFLRMAERTAGHGFYVTTSKCSLSRTLALLGLGECS